ncbi:MAG TPA: vWA domain-containing protein, partial [Nitrospiraceae bacterium]
MPSSRGYVASGRKTGTGRLRSFNQIGLLALLLLILGISSVSARRTSGPSLATDCVVPDSFCPQNPNIDLVVMLDRSGSLSEPGKGEAYNIQVEGLAVALRDVSVIPRDGSVAISVFTFADQATLTIPPTLVSSHTVAESLAEQVKALACPGRADCPVPGDLPGTDFGNAIDEAGRLLSHHGRSGARRVLVLSTDGECTDADCGRQASANFRQVGSELDVLLIAGSTTRTLTGANEIAFPEPAEGLTSLPGATVEIGQNGCNGGPGTCDSASRADSATEFADVMRRVLRSHVTPGAIEVTSAADSLPGLAASSDALTLRQAIEQANSRGGSATITFNLSQPATIRL